MLSRTLRGKAPPWTKLFLILCTILGLGALWHPVSTDAATTKLNSHSGVNTASLASGEQLVINTMATATRNEAMISQEAGPAYGTCTACFGHCTFYGYSNAAYAMEIPNNATGEGFTFATMMTTSDGDPTMAVALMPTTITAGNTNAVAVTTNYSVSTMPAGFNPAAYTSEGATRRNTGHAPMYGELTPEYRLSRPTLVKTRYSRQLDRATRASPAHSTFNRRPLSRYC